MKISKQKIWILLQIAVAAYLIISSCFEPYKTAGSGEVIVKDQKPLTGFQEAVFNPFIKTGSFSKVSGHLEWPDTYHRNSFFINSNQVF